MLFGHELAGAGTARGSCPGTRRRGRSGTRCCHFSRASGKFSSTLDGAGRACRRSRRRSRRRAAAGRGRTRRRRSGRRRTRPAAGTPPGRRGCSSRSRSASGCRAGRSASGRARAPRGTAFVEPDLVGLVVDREVRTGSRAAAASRRRMRPHAAWNVRIQIARATPPSMSSSRSRISPAALFVNVIARISCGLIPQRVDQVRDAVGEDARLAGAGAGDDEQRALGREHGLPLGGVQVGEVGLGGGDWHAPPMLATRPPPSPGRRLRAERESEGRARSGDRLRPLDRHRRRRRLR